MTATRQPARQASHPLVYLQTTDDRGTPWLCSADGIIMDAEGLHSGLVGRMFDKATERVTSWEEADDIYPCNIRLVTLAHKTDKKTEVNNYIKYPLMRL